MKPVSEGAMRREHLVSAIPAVIDVESVDGNLGNKISWSMYIFYKTIQLQTWFWYTNNSMSFIYQTFNFLECHGANTFHHCMSSLSDSPYQTLYNAMAGKNMFPYYRYEVCPPSLGLTFLNWCDGL